MRNASVWLLLAALASAAVLFQVDNLALQVVLGGAAAGLAGLWAVNTFLNYRDRHKRPHRSYYGRMPDFELPTASEAEAV